MHGSERRGSGNDKVGSERKIRARMGEMGMEMKILPGWVEVTEREDA